MKGSDTVFVLISAALVLLMTPALAFFYGGMVRRKNALSTMMQSIFLMCLIGVQWIIYGYSLSFAPGGSFWGGLQWFMLKGVGMEPNAELAGTIPHQVFMIFQAMFAIITPALITGAFAERMKFSAFVLISLLWATFVYAPVCHWIWGIGGFLKKAGFLDFAGGAVVHINAGISALIIALLIGKRKNLDKNFPSPHNLPFVLIGTGLLWFGWFGFNAGSALAVNKVAANAFITTNTAGAAAGLAWSVMEWIKNGKPTVLGILTGIIAGLATITPAAGFVTVPASIAIGIITSIICFASVSIFKPKFGYDDSLDAFGVHGIGGIVGIICTGLFATKLVNDGGADGLFYGNPSLLLTQIKGTLITVVYAAFMTFIIYKFVDFLIGVRVKEKEELIGLDLTQHSEKAYSVLE